MEVNDIQENYNTGWIKLYRSIKHKSWYNKPDHLRIWIHLMIKATHQKYEFNFHGEPMTLEPGQLVTGRKKLSKELNISESKVERVLTYFEKKEAQIEQRTDRQKRVITILNWNQYQQIEQRVNNDRTTTEQRLDTNKNIKNVKNEKKYIFKPPAFEEIESYCKEKNWCIDIQAFIDFYASKNWMVGKNKMSNWRAAVSRARQWDINLNLQSETKVITEDIMVNAMKKFEDIHNANPGSTNEQVFKHMRELTYEHWPEIVDELEKRLRKWATEKQQKDQ